MAVEPVCRELVSPVKSLIAKENTGKSIGLTSHGVLALGLEPIS
jgi:hypothetical protein